MTFKNPGICILLLLMISAFSQNTAAEMAGGQVSETAVCFTVDFPGDTIPSIVRGTLYSTQKYDWDGRAVVLLHGAASDRSAWTGIAPFTPNTAHNLARRGYGVFAIDRLGYGESPYERPPGLGYALSVDVQIETVRDVVTQIQEGSFLVSEGSCEAGTLSGQTANSVFMAGHSSGALIAQAFATRYDDLAGIILMAWSSMGNGDALSWLVFNHIVPQIFGGNDYVSFVPYVDGYSLECENGFFNAPGVDPSVIETVCTEGFLNLTPSGEFISLDPIIAEVAANVGNTGDTATLYVQGSQDAFMPGPAGGPSGEETDIQTPEIEYWQDNCNCEVSVLEALHAGHMIQAHRDMKSTSARIANWLDQH